MFDLFDLDRPDLPPCELLPMIIDSFAGGGGASTGIELALGRSPDVAINHDEVALSMHAKNHPATHHVINSVYAIDPRDLPARGQRVGLSWFSPDCKHHSKAKGGKPLNKNIRDLAWVVVHHAETIRPEVILLENVEEFEDWGPLTPEQKPDPAQKGKTFRSWVAKLRRLGYSVQWRVLRACDYGAPTIRKRLFVVARCDGKKIVWPTPTHGDPESEAVQTGLRKPWGTAADIIDWSIPCPSIFDTSEQIMEKHGVRAVRPLADNTLRRIARGVMKYVVNAKEPFIVVCNHAGKGFRGQSLNDPLATVTAARDATGLVVPTLVQTGYGEREGQKPRSLDIQKPIGTMVAGGAKHAIVAPSLISVAHGYSGGRREYPIDDPIGTMSAGGTQHALVSAFLAQHNAGPKMENNAGRRADVPLSTLTTRGTQQNVVAASMVNMRGTSESHLRGADVRDPLGTVTASGNHAALVAAFLMKYYSTDQDPRLDAPLHTCTTKDRFGLVTVEIAGQPYAIVDIGMRMLTPREQFRAQGFDDSYVIDRGHDGRTIPKTHQTHKCGNSVCPPVAQALVEANCAHLINNGEDA